VQFLGMVINTKSGGNGDVWMRLVGFYTLAGLLKENTIKVVVPDFMGRLADLFFGDRLIIVSNVEKSDYTFSSLGLRHLLHKLVKGQKIILPYHRSVLKDKKKSTWKDRINDFILNLISKTSRILLPPWDALNKYQAFLDVCALPAFKSIEYDLFCNQLEIDRLHFWNKFKGDIPVSFLLDVPEDLSTSVLVFPTGTSRQFMPLWWAKKYLPNAYFAFFHKDKDADNFRSAGLKVIEYFEEAGDIIYLSRIALKTITTDSFPSHLLQFSTNNIVILITEVLKSRIVSPVFKGLVIDAVAPCHPCLHLERKKFPLCQAGRSECINWAMDSYKDSIEAAIFK